MSAASMIVRDVSGEIVGFSHETEQLKAAALESSALIARVSTPEEQQTAVQAQMALDRLIKDVEKSRVAAKDPVLQYGKRIDDTAKKFIKDLFDERSRISGLVGDFQQLEQAKARAAQAAENARLLAIERERMAELAQAKTHEEMDKVQEKFDNRAQQQAPAPIAPARAAGQVVKEDWEVTVNDIHALYRAHPNCCNVTARVSDIKSLLNAGIKVAGVSAKRVVSSSVRSAGRTIDV